MHFDGLQATFAGNGKEQLHTAEYSVLPAEVESWRILLEKEDESVWSADEYIYKNVRGVTGVR